MDTNYLNIQTTTELIVVLSAIALIAYTLVILTKNEKPKYIYTRKSLVRGLISYALYTTLFNSD